VPKNLHCVVFRCIFTVETMIKNKAMKTQNEYKINTKVNGNFTNIYVNFTDGTYGKITLRSYQTRKGLRYSKFGDTEGTYNRNKWAISVDELFANIQVTKLSEKRAEVGQKLNHSLFGEVEVLSANNTMVKIKLSDGTEKRVMADTFMNFVK